MIIDYVSNLAIPLVILIVLIFGVSEKKKTFDIFLDGAKEGLEIVIRIFPTLIGLFLAVGALRNSGILEILINLLTPIIKILHIPNEIIPLAILRPISRECFYCNRNRYNAKLWS